MTSKFGGVPVQSPDQYPVGIKSKFGGTLLQPAPDQSPAPHETTLGSLGTQAEEGFISGVTGMADIAERAVPVLGSIRNFQDLNDKNKTGLRHILPDQHDMDSVLGGLNPDTHPAMTTAERLARGFGEGATAVLLPGGAEYSLGRAAANMILGGLSGFSGSAAAEAAPPGMKPYAEMIGSVAGAFLPSGLKGLVAPKISPHVEKLLAEGVHLTPGQIAGGMGILGRTAKTVEDAVTSIPYVGDIVRSAQRRGLQSFQIAAVNRALGAIGQKIPKGIEAGRAAVKYAGDQLSAAYDRVLPQLHIPIDKAFTTEVQDIRRSLSVLPKQIREQFDGILKDVVASKFDVKTKTMDGQDFKKAEAELNRLANKYSGHSATPDQQEMADHIGDLRAELHDLVERSNPVIAPKIRAINTGYAILTRIERAAGSTGAVDGLFTAPQLQNAVKALDRSSRKRAFARGQALLQDLSDAGTSVLPSKVPDSGTATRGITAAALTGAGGLAAHLNPATLGVMGGVAGMYTRPGTKAMEYALTRRPYNIQSASQLFDQVGVGRSVPAAIGASGVTPFLNQQQQQ